MKCAKFEYIKNNLHSNRKEKKYKTINKEIYPGFFKFKNKENSLDIQTKREKTTYKKGKIELALYFGIATFHAKDH